HTCVIHLPLHSSPTRRSSDLADTFHCCVTSPPYWGLRDYGTGVWEGGDPACPHTFKPGGTACSTLDHYDNGLNAATIERKIIERSEEHTSELQSLTNIGFRLL